MKGKCFMWERFSTSGLAGAYVDELAAAGREARMEFRPRRALDPCPFLVTLEVAKEGETFLSLVYDVASCAARGGT